MVKEISSIEALLEPTISALGYELLGCTFVPQARGGLLRLYIDSPQGIKITDCETVSRQVSAVLDVEDPIMGAYTLEVSSPGLNRPLFKLAHYQQYIGSMVNVRLQIPIDNRRQFRGVLVAVIGHDVIVKVDDQEFKLPYSNIAKANLIVDVLMKSREK